MYMGRDVMERIYILAVYVHIWAYPAVIMLVNNIILVLFPKITGIVYIPCSPSPLLSLISNNVSIYMEAMNKISHVESSGRRSGNSDNNGFMVDHPKNGTALEMIVAQLRFFIKGIRFNIGVYTAMTPMLTVQNGSSTGGKKAMPKKDEIDNKIHTNALASVICTVPWTRGRLGLLIRSTSTSCISFNTILAAEIH